MNIPVKDSCDIVEVSTFEEALIRIRELEHELQCMSGVMRVMREDLQASNFGFYNISYIVILFRSRTNNLNFCMLVSGD